jgi:hypothetical protein
VTYEAVGSQLKYKFSVMGGVEQLINSNTALRITGGVKTVHYSYPEAPRADQACAMSSCGSQGLGLKQPQVGSLTSTHTMNIP